MPLTPLLGLATEDNFLDFLTFKLLILQVHDRALSVG